MPIEPLRGVTATCRSGCLGLDAGAPGSEVRLTADGLGGAAGIVFLGRSGPDDDVTAGLTSATPGTVSARVPAGARTGPLAVAFADGRTARAAGRPFVLDGPRGEAVQARVSSRKLFFAGRRRPTLDVFVPDGPPQRIAADVVRLADGAVLASLDAGEVAGGSVTSLQWNGVAAGRVQRDGRYAFRLGVPGQGTPRQRSAAPTPMGIAPDAAFEFLRHEYPVRGASTFGTGAATFGGGRNHQGFDVFAQCGTPLVAARGGRVKFAGSHVRAGNYLVIDGVGEGYDHAYMHLKDPVAFTQGDEVATGQPIGAVGETGRASGCHLHFELWKAPGWYSGGAPIDPGPTLRAWAGQSGSSSTIRAARQSPAPPQG